MTGWYPQRAMPTSLTLRRTGPPCIWSQCRPRWIGSLVHPPGRGAQRRGMTRPSCVWVGEDKERPKLVGESKEVSGSARRRPSSRRKPCATWSVTWSAVPVAGQRRSQRRGVARCPVAGRRRSQRQVVQGFSAVADVVEDELQRASPRTRRATACFCLGSGSGPGSRPSDS